MPTLSRFVRTIVIVAGVVFGAMVALATLVPPHTRTMTEPIDGKILRQAGRAPSA